MTVDDGGLPPLPWQAAALADALQRQRGHALLLHGAAGVGSLHFGVALAQGWLCEGNAAARPCGRCGSCRMVQAHLHPDLFVLLPQTLRQQHGWPLADDKPDDDGKKKPSKQIRIDEVRAAIDWVTRTSARGRGKVVLIHPAEALNVQAANALLKTLEEPPAGTRLLLGVADPAHLLPTVRSRCQRLVLPLPTSAQALQWLAGQGLDGADVLLAGASGRPLEALELAQAGIDGAAWAALPRAVAGGQGGAGAAMAGWPVPRALDALLKLCHDAMAQAAGAAPRYFPAGSMPAALRSVGAAGMAGLVDWQRSLLRVARHDEHPWHEGLLLDALLAQGRRALTLPT